MERTTWDTLTSEQKWELYKAIVTASLISEEENETLFVTLSKRVTELEAALKTVIDCLDDPTGGTHVQDMRQAQKIAAAALEVGISKWKT